MIVLLILLVGFLLILLGVVIYAVVIYNGLVQLKNNIEKAWSNIDVLLKQRFDELPKLVNVCEGYMQHERKTLEAITKARSMIENAHTDDEAIKANNALSGALKSLFAVVENYPNLKADASFRQLQSRISELEDLIADRREFYNESVNLFNIRIEQVPDVIIAKKFNFTARQLWKIDPNERSDVKVEIQQTGVS